MQGDDLHAARIRFQSQQLGLVIGIGMGDAALQPVEQAMQAQRVRGGLLQLLAQLQVVGHATLAVDQLQQAFGLFGAQIRNQRERAAALPAIAPVQQPRLVMALRIALDLERGDRGGILAQQHGRQGGAQAAAVGRLQQREQQGAQFASLDGFEQALLAGGHGGHARARQGLLHAGGILVVAHQHRDVAGLHGTPVDQRMAFACIGEHAMDVGDAGGGGGHARAVGAQWLAVFAPQQAQGQRRCGRSIAQVIGVGALVARPHRLETDARMGEGIQAGLVRAFVQCLDGAQHAWARAEVVRQPRCFVGHAAGEQVGVHVAAAETVDGLLGIADQEQRGHLAQGTHLVGIAEHARENPPLALVGVLEFVHQCDPVLRAQPRHQRLSFRPLQRLGHAFDQIVVGLHAAGALECVQAPARLGAQMVQQANGLIAPPLPAALQCPQVVGNQRLQGRQRRLAGMRLVGPGRQRLVGEPFDALVQREQWVRPLAPLA